MLEFDNLAEFRDPQTYDLLCDEVDEELPLIEEWARKADGPLLDIACGTGRTALRMAARGYQVTGVDVASEMIERGREKASAQGVSVEWAVADVRDFHLQRRFRCAYMVGNAFQFLLTRPDQEALLARVREHLHPEGYLLFETRNPSPRNLYEPFRPAPQTYTTPDGGQLIVAYDPPVYDPMTQIQRHTAPHE